jgi:glycosyltransferase involved in cell wall biosynthesis
MNSGEPSHRAGLDREIVLDICRLATRLMRLTPNGIDRVDASFAAHFLAADVPNRKAFLLTPLGPRAVSLSAARRILEGVQHQWREQGRPETDHAFLRVRAALAGPPPANRNLACTSSRELPARSFGGLLSAGRKAALLHASAWTKMDAIGANAVYLNVCQFPLYVASYFRWLRKRPDVKPVFMIHDLLPIEHPEFFRPSEFRRHARRLGVFAQIGAGVIVSTPALADALLAYLWEIGRKTMPVLVQPLPVSPTFHERREHDEALAARPYFVICGTIEPRKNHLLLLNLWRELAQSLGPSAPKLVVAGARGWENENVLDMLERCSEIRGHVIEAPGLSTPSLKRLIDNARAVLMPSFAEGYGLPVAEALTAGTPVLASDLPSLRAMSKVGITWLDPLDGLGWLAAIRRLSETTARGTESQRDWARQAFSGESYFQKIEAFLSTI